MRATIAAALLPCACGNGTAPADMAASADLSVPAPLVCSVSLADACATEWCPQAKADVLARFCADAGGFDFVNESDCGDGKTIVIVSFTDTADEYVFDSSGQLFAMIALGPFGQSACAGPPTLDFTACRSETQVCSH